MPSYVTVDKKKTTRSDDIVAILAKKGRKNKSEIISRKDTYYSRTSSKRLAERLEGEKEKKGSPKKRR